MEEKVIYEDYDNIYNVIEKNKQNIEALIKDIENIDLSKVDDLEVKLNDLTTSVNSIVNLVGFYKSDDTKMLLNHAISVIANVAKNAEDNDTLEANLNNLITSVNAMNGRPTSKGHFATEAELKAVKNPEDGDTGWVGATGSWEQYLYDGTTSQWEKTGGTSNHVVQPPQIVEKKWVSYTPHTLLAKMKDDYDNNGGITKIIEWQQKRYIFKKSEDISSPGGVVGHTITSTPGIMKLTYSTDKDGTTIQSGGFWFPVFYLTAFDRNAGYANIVGPSSDDHFKWTTQPPLTGPSQSDGWSDPQTGAPGWVEVLVYE